MDKINSLIVFQDKKIRRIWFNDEWWFSVVDVIGILSESEDARNYWKVLKHRLNEEGSEVVTRCNQLKLMSSDGKYYETDCANTETLFRLIQSIPSKKAEPFKVWLAKVGYQRIEETEDPELAFDRAIKTYFQKGYPKKWINQRLKTIEVRKELTDEWNRAGIEKESDFAILTNEITKAWSGKTVSEYDSVNLINDGNIN